MTAPPALFSNIYVYVPCVCVCVILGGFKNKKEGKKMQMKKKQEKRGISKWTQMHISGKINKYTSP
jgi:hypothetical protein